MLRSLPIALTASIVLLLATVALPLMATHTLSIEPVIATESQDATAERSAVASPADPPSSASQPEVSVSPAELLMERSRRPVAQRIQPALRTALQRGALDGPTLVTVQSARRLDLSAFADRVHHFTWPAGERVAVLWVQPDAVYKLAGTDGVATVQWTDPAFVEEASAGIPVADPEVLSEHRPLDPQTLRDMYAAAPSWDETARLRSSRSSLAATGDAEMLGGSPTGADPAGWFDARKGHAAAEAWELGYRGEGVRVAVIDTSVDFAHPDLQDAWAVYPEDHTHAGWAQVFDPLGAQQLMLDETGMGPGNQVLTAQASHDIIRMQQTITATETEAGGRTVFTGCFQSRALVMASGGVQPVTTDARCDWVLPTDASGALLSKSGTVHFGWHKDYYAGFVAADPSASPPVFAEYPGVLLVDAEEAGVYDTVFVDIDLDRDFSNDKPMTKADPLGWRDITGDGIADLSAGLLYWIADGETRYPGSWVWGFDGVPDAAKYVAIHSDTGGHGTLCASNVASRGRLGVPDALAVRYRDLPDDGKPMPFNPGMAPAAELVSIGFGLAHLDQSWRFALLGADPDDPRDDVQITSNSYGNSGADDEGWNESSRMADYYIRTFNPTAVALFSTGNGAPGYGTVASPVPATSMNIAASTQMGSTGWDSIFETGQITYGDITPFSNRGPSAMGFPGPHVATDGAFAAGAGLINTITTNSNRGEAYRGGEFGNQTWGGTSRSSPIAAGILATVYQAFRDTHDRWPTWREIRAIAMASGRYNGYDVLSAGAGVLDAGDAVRIASGVHGVFADPPEWTAGDYRGQRYEAFAKVMHPGDTATQSFTLRNQADEPIEVALSQGRLRRIEMEEITFSSNVVTDETQYSFNAPDYLIELDRASVPEDAELLEVEFVTSLASIDKEVSDTNPDGDLNADSVWRLGVFQHTDWNDDQLLWDDADGDGHVDKVVSDEITQTIDVNPNLAKLDYSQSEIQEGEYIRFAYNSNVANNQAVYVHHPLERWSSGMYVGLWHNVRSPAIPTAEMKIRLTYFRHEPWPWLSLGAETVTVPAATDGIPGEATFEATVTVPDGAPFGGFPGAIFADSMRLASDPPAEGPGGWEHPDQRVVIPVFANVAARYDWDGALTFGGTEGHDADAPYDNGTVSGRQSWNWRPESGDWRFFFFDALPSPAGWASNLLVHTEWAAIGKNADVDSRLYGPASDRFSDPGHPDNQPGEDGETEDMSDPAFYGPYTLAPVVSSPRVVSGGKWPFNTTTGASEDLLSGRSRAGLHQLMLHNVLLSGERFDMPFESRIGSLRWSPRLPVVVGEECSNVTIAHDLELEEVDVTAYGLAEVIEVTDTVTMTQNQSNPAVDSWRYDLEIPSEAGALEIVLEGPGDGATDLDLFLVYDANGDGQFQANGETVASSTTPDDQERISVDDFQPPGAYQVWVHGWQVAGEAEFDLRIEAVYGSTLSVEPDADAGTAGAPWRVRVCATDVLGREESGRGILVLQSARNPVLARIPVQWHPEGYEPLRPTIFLPHLVRNAPMR